MKQRILDTGNTIALERPDNNVPSAMFDLSHDVKVSCEFGQLIPVCVMECIPGDSFKIQSEALVRMQALISPVLHRLNVRSEWFFVPNRIIWENWEQFISPQNPNNTPPVMPFFEAGSISSVDVGGLLDYLGVPTGVPVPRMNCLAVGAYNRIVYDWYTDLDLVEGGSSYEPYEPPKLHDGNQDDLIETLQIAFRNFDRDYFTSAKPFTQKGPAVTIPMASNIGNVPVSFTGGGPTRVVSTDGETFIPNDTGMLLQGAGDLPVAYTNAGGGNSVTVDNSQSLAIEGGELAGIMGTIEQLRQCEALQQFLEADSRGGTRYIELLQMHFGVKSSDARLQRSEYIGSTNQPLVISEVLNTTGTDTIPQGGLAGHGIAVGRTNQPMNYYCEEHGTLMCIMSVLPATGYYQGVHKQFLKFDRLDFAWPEFAHLGEQVVQNQEIYVQGNESDTETFGYLPIYSEYRMQPNRVCGTFRTSLDFWHVARKFSSLPTLTNGFIEADYDLNQLNRIFATLDDTGHFLCHWFHLIKAMRKLPRYVRPNI